jgi:hypothetical protein
VDPRSRGPPAQRPAPRRPPCRAGRDGAGRSIEAGHQPEPGLALLRPAQGRIEAAAGVVRRAGAETQEPPARSRLLPAYVEIMLTSGDVAAAHVAAEELGQIAQLLDAPYLCARWRRPRPVRS